MKFSDLISNSDGRLSTTGAIQFLSWLIVSGLLIFAVIANKPLASEWYELYLLLCVFGSPLSKGAISILKNDKQKSE